VTGEERGFGHKENDRKESFGLYFLSVIEIPFLCILSTTIKKET
jgi:hypothetical protein